MRRMLGESVCGAARGKNDTTRSSFAHLVWLPWQMVSIENDIQINLQIQNIKVFDYGGKPNGPGSFPEYGVCSPTRA